MFTVTAVYELLCFTTNNVLWWKPKYYSFSKREMEPGMSLPFPKKVKETGSSPSSVLA